MIELQVVFQLYIIIKIFEEIYKHNQLIVFFKKNAENIEKNTLEESGDINLRSMFSHSVYKFLQVIILKVEIKMDDKDSNEKKEFDEDEDEDLNDFYSLHQEKNKANERIATKIKNLLKKDKAFSNLMNINRKMKNNNIMNNYNNKIKEEEKNDIEYSSLMENEDEFDENDEEKSKIKTMFFQRPYLTFFLSKSTKDRFINTVDRSTVSSKFNSLLNFADYCLYEMVVNKHLIGTSKFNNFCANIDYSIVEIINYVFIVIQNILILIQFYKKTDLPYEKYYSFEQSKVRKLRLENIIIAIIQELFLIVFLITWYLFKFMNSCQYYIMEEFHKQFVGKRIGEDEKIPQIVVDYFQGKDISTTTFFHEVNKRVTNWEKLYVYVLSTHLFNREIIMLVLSLILNICYFATRNPLFLVVQVLFIANIISTLFDIIYAIKLKWKNIVLLILFDFIAIYVFMWFGFFFFPYFFIYNDVLFPASQESVTEGFCFSSVQCYLFFMSRGSLSNGGISNDIERISYKDDVGNFMGRFFFDVLFFLLISLYIGKMFLSFIIDTFGELRSQNADNTNDKENICFICQISRDECLMKNIDFDKHIKYVHNMWNYVYYLNYLYVNNPFNFNWIENSVWEKLQEQGINWIPLKED
jgi:inositol 1,4,5-triphosphate receptor type 3